MSNKYIKNLINCLICFEFKIMIFDDKFWQNLAFYPQPRVS